MVNNAPRKNWFIFSSYPGGTENDTINLDYVSRVQYVVADKKIHVILGNNLGDGTSGSNAIVTYGPYSTDAEALADYTRMQAMLLALGHATDLRPD